MSKTQAAKQKAYRDRKRNAVTPDPVTRVTIDDTRRVTVPESRVDLPADVVAGIERMCAESNNGERAANHCRQVMTERALHCQQACGKR